MSLPVLIAIDMNKLELQNAAIQTLSSAPSSPVLGQIYFNSVDLELYIWDGTAWGLVATDAKKLNGQVASYYLSRANHTGTQLASTISNFDTQVRTNRLDQMAAPTADVSLNGFKITSLANGVSSTDAINKGQLDAALQGLSNKHTADYGTTAALPAVTYSNGTSGVGATLTENSNGALSVDGASPAVGDTILVKDQVNAAHNGLYVVTAAGSGAAPFILTRATEMDTSTEFSGAIVAIRAGSTNDGSLWLLNSNDPFVVGTDNAVFVNINSAVTYTAGNGIDISGTVLTVKLASGGGLQFNGSGEIELIDVYSNHKYAANIGNGSLQSFTLTHNLGTRDLTVAVYDNSSPYQEVLVDIRHTSTTTATVIFGTVPTTNQYRVVITG